MAPEKRFLAIFSCWMVLYGPKQCCMIRAYRCAALDTPLAYVRKKIDPRPPVGGRSAARRAVFRPPGRILARKSVFCYCTPDFVNGPFVALAKAVDLAPSDPFLNFSFPSYGRFREGDPPTQQKVLPHLTVGALTDSNSPSALSARAG